MRIISGKYKSRILTEPKGNIAHPMGERVRAALFNILHDVSDFTVFDAFGGSGAIAIEAVSRGAKSAIVIEKSPKIYKTLKQNVESLGLEDDIKVTKLLGEDGIFVLSQFSDTEPQAIDGLKLISSHEYGNATLVFYRQ